MRFPHLRRGRSAAAVAALLALSASGPAARAGLMTFDAVPYTGSPARVTVTFDDVTAPGTVRVTVTVDPSPSVGDINGFFFNVGDESLLPGLTVTGGDVTLLVKGANGVTRAGPGNNINGQGVGPFDVGLQIGTPGIGKDDIQSTTFVLSDPAVFLTDEMFTGATTEDGDVFAVRLTSVGPPGSARNGSSKLRGGGPPPGGPPDVSTPIPPSEAPEPSTLAGLAALGGLGLLARRLWSARR